MYSYWVEVNSRMLETAHPNIHHHAAASKDSTRALQKGSTSTAISYSLTSTLGTQRRTARPSTSELWFTQESGWLPSKAPAHAYRGLTGLRFVASKVNKCQCSSALLKKGHGTSGMKHNGRHSLQPRGTATEVPSSFFHQSRRSDDT